MGRSQTLMMADIYTWARSGQRKPRRKHSLDVTVNENLDRQVVFESQEQLG